MKFKEKSKTDIDTMLAMRADGYTNRDIARCLDCSPTTVLKYIGKQPLKLQNLSAYDTKAVQSKASSDFKPDNEKAKEELKRIDVKLTKAEYQYGSLECLVDYTEKSVAISIPTTMTFEEMYDLAVFINNIASKLGGDK